MDTTMINFKFGKAANESTDEIKLEKKTMTERERLQASLKQTLTEFKQNANKETKNGQASQGGQGGAKKENNRQIGNYIVGKTLGQGTFGKVREGTHTLTQEKVAIKILEKEKINDQADITRVMREIQILKIVRHANIVQLYEIIETSKQLFLIMEYAPGGELFDYIVKKKRLQDAEACRFFHQILAGIEYLHANKICHRDLKPENLLLDENMNIKIVDFGLSNTYKSANDTLKTACGSPCYASPEMIAGKRYSGLDTDIWSLGVILYAMTVGYLPFEDPDTNKLYKKILSCDYLVPGYVTKPAKDMLKKILQVDPKKRAKIDEIKKHVWYMSVQWAQLDGIIVGKDKIPILDQIKMEMESNKEIKSVEGIQNLVQQVEMNKHNPITATYYLLIKKYERNTDQNLVFGKFTRDKRLLEQMRDQGGSTKNLPVNTSGPMVIEANKPNSNSIAVIKENYGSLEKSNFNLMMQSQPKSEQKFRSQTRDNHQRIKPDTIVVENLNQSQAYTKSGTNRLPGKQNVRQLLVQKLIGGKTGEKGTNSFDHSGIVDSVQNDSQSNFNIIITDAKNTQSLNNTLQVSQGSLASNQPQLKITQQHQSTGNESLSSAQRYTGQQMRNKVKINRNIISNIQLDKKGQQVRITQMLDGQRFVIEDQPDKITQSEVVLNVNQKRGASVENSRSQTRSVVAEKNRAFIMNDFLPKVESMPTQDSMIMSDLEKTQIKERMNTTYNKFGPSSKKIKTSVEEIAARIAQRNLVQSEAYNGVFTSSGVVLNGEPNLMQRSIPVNKQNQLPSQKQRATQINFFSNDQARLNSSQGNIVKGISLETRQVNANANQSGNTSLLSYNTQQLKGFTQAQSALQMYMRNRVGQKQAKIQPVSNSYFQDQYDSIQHVGYTNQSIPVANTTIYRSNKPVNQNVTIKNAEGNTLQNLIGNNNSMNATIKGGRSNHFFVAQDHLKSDVYQNHSIQLKVLAQNSVKKGLIKVGPAHRGILVSNQNRRSQAPQQIMPYADQSFASAQFNPSQISIEGRASSNGRAVTTNKLAATITGSAEPWAMHQTGKIMKGATQTKYNFHPKNQYYLL